MTTTSEMLEVPGARLSHAVVGDGRLLLTIPGGAADSSTFGPIAPLLSAEHSVLTYDPRGISASQVSDPHRDITVADQAEDARQLAAAYSGEDQIDVLANSAGAITALELAAQNPGLVRTLVAHEPPVAYLLPGETDEPDGLVATVARSYRDEGTMPAIQLFLDRIGVFGAQPVPPREALEPMRANFDVFFGRAWKPLFDWRADLDKLRDSGTRIVVAVGRQSTGQFAATAAAALAAKLGSPPVEVPGDHFGPTTGPAAFAAELVPILR